MNIRSFSLFLTCLALVSFFTRAADALPSYITFPSDVDWVTRESDHFDIIYRRGQDAFAKRALRAAERAYSLLTPIFPEAPRKTWLVLADFQDATNGYALTFPYPHMVIFAAPPEAAGQLSSLDDWLDSVILHEYVHILHIYPANGLWGVLRTIFGSWVVPNGLMPSHFHEGLAVLLETEKSKGGRGRSSLFSMYRRMAVDAKVWGTSDFLSLDRMDGTLNIYPHGTSAYFFGYNLYRELWNRKGPKGIYDLVSEYSSNWPYFLNLPAENVYGADYPSLWEDIFKKTTEEELKAIERARKEPLVQPRYLTGSRYSKSNVTLSPDGKRVAYRRWNPEWGGAIDLMAWESQHVIRSIETNGSSAEGMCWLASGPTEWLLYIDSEATNNYTYNVLKLHHLGTDERRELRADKMRLRHLHQLACGEDGATVLVYQEAAGVGWVKELELVHGRTEPTLTLKRKWKVPTGAWVSGLLVGNEHWVGVRAGTETTFYRWKKGKDPQKVVELAGSYYSFRAGKQGEDLMAISNVEGRDEIWSVDFEKKESVKRVALLGGTNSFDVKGRTVVFSSFRHGGYDVAHSVLADIKTAKFQKVPVTPREPAREIKISEREEYSPLGSLLPRAWVPSALFVPDGLQIGAWIPGFDISQRHFYNIIAGYDTRGLPFADVAYTRRFGSSYSLLADTFYFPSYIQSTRNFFKRWGSSLGVGGNLPWFPVYAQLTAIFKRVEAVGVFPANQSVGLQLSLGYKFGYKRRPVSISQIAGTSISVTHAQYFRFLGSKDNYFSTIGAVDQYFEAPWWKEHVFYVGAKVGYTEGTPLYNNFFEAGGELLFYQARGTFLNRGFLPGLLLNRRIANLNLEYRFPIAYIERGYQYRPFNLKVLHAALTTDVSTIDLGALSTAPKNLFKVYYVSSGLELRSDWTVAFYIPAIFRVGAYHGFGPFGENIYVTFGVEASI